MKRFELHINPKTDSYDIVDNLESNQKGAICIYNDLGDCFSSAPALCDLLNSLDDEIIVLKTKLYSQQCEQDRLFKKKHDLEGMKYLCIKLIDEYCVENNLNNKTFDVDVIELNYFLSKLRNYLEKGKI